MTQKIDVPGLLYHLDVEHIKKDFGLFEDPENGHPLHLNTCTIIELRLKHYIQNHVLPYLLPESEDYPAFLKAVDNPLQSMVTDLAGMVEHLRKVIDLQGYTVQQFKAMPIRIIQSNYLPKAKWWMLYHAQRLL